MGISIRVQVGDQAPSTAVGMEDMCAPLQRVGRGQGRALPGQTLLG